MDRVDAMRAFVTVVTHRSFTRAAQQRNMSPQLVSKYVSQLEDHLGVRLLNRTTRQIHPTEVGARYFEQAQQILEDIDAMESQVNELQQGARGRLRISAPVSFATRHLAPLLQAFQHQHPAVSIDLHLNDRKIDIVDEGFDIALRIGRLKNSSLIAKRIAPVRLVICASPQYLALSGTPTHPEQLKEHRYLHYSYMDQGTKLLPDEWFANGAPGQQGGMVCNNGDMLVNAAIAGAGIAVQPTFICGQAIAEGKLQRILPTYEPAPMGLYAVYAHRKLLASKVRCFIDFIDGYFGDRPYWDDF